MPLKLKYDAKAGKLVEVPGAWIGNKAEITAEAHKIFRESYSLDAEVQLLRNAMIGVGKEHLPAEYLTALSELDERVNTKTAEAESQALLIDRSKWAAAGIEKTKTALASAGLAVTAPVKTVAELEKFVDEKISNLDEMANAAKL